MTGSRTKVRSVLLVVVMLVGTVPAVGVGSVAASTGNTTGNAPDAFHVQQAGQCYEVGSLGDGTQLVEEFYDYRNNETDPESYNYSSYGTTHLQGNQQSKLAVYNGSDGYSLVVLHDKYALDGGDGSNASTVSFVLSDVGDASWAVQDDYYGEGTQDDNWDTAGNTHEVDWKWASNRSDGGALRGIVGESITIDPGFNDDAEAWGSWPYSGDDQNRTEDWRAIDGSSDYRLERSLDMTEDLTVEAGPCPDAGSPDADLTASPNPAANDESVTLDASDSTDDSGVDQYHWDFDGDGEIDERTTDATVEHAYDPGEYDATVVVVDDNNKQDVATTTVEVVDSTEPAVSVDAPDEVAVGHEFELSADARADYDIDSYEWDFGDTTKSGQQVAHTYDETGEHDVTLSWESTDGESGSETVTVHAKQGTVEFLNGTAVRVNGTFEAVDLTLGYYASDGYGQSRHVEEDVSGSTVINVTEDHGVNGTVINDAALYDSFPDGEPVTRKEHPNLDYWAEAIKPEPVTVSVDEVTEVEDGTYDVTFAYENHNEEALNYSDSSVSGHVSGDAPTELAPGEGTFTVTWTPDSDSERAVWTVDRSNFGQSDLSAGTPKAGDIDGGSDDNEPPTAAISAVDEAPISDTLWLDARDSTDDDEITAYKYYVDGELLWQDNGPTPDRTSLHPWEHLDGTGTYEMSVKVWDSAGQTDTASTTVEVVKEDHEKPEADIEMDGTATVGETVTFRAANITEDSETLTHVCWELNGTPTVEDHTWNATFEDPGPKEITLVLNDRAGNYNEVTRTVHVAADDGGDGDDGKDGGDGDDGKDGGLDDGDDRDSRTGGIPGVAPGDDSDDEDEQALADRPENVSANLTDGDARIGGVVVVPHASADDFDVEAYGTAPEGLPAPTPDQDGFEALSFVTASGADHANVTVSADRLDAIDAAPGDVTLFRYENESWTAVETSVTNETGDAYQFRANVTDGTYAVGVEQPAIGVADLTVQDETVTPGEAATVAVTVENDGLANGTRQVTLSVGGEQVDTRNVSIPAGEWRTLRFAPTFASDGAHEVSVGDASAEVVVEAVDTTSTTTTETTDSGGVTTTDSTTAEDESAGVPGFGVGVALVALLAGTLLALRRR